MKFVEGNDNLIKLVTTKVSRWNVEFTITYTDGREETFIASADSSLAESGIWFGTKREYEEETSSW